MPNWSDFFPDVPYAGAFGTGTPQEEATRAPTPVDKAVGKAGQIAMIPGQAYNSQTPISTDQMVGPATDLASFVTLGSGAMPAEANALRMGIKAYHGSPHDFDRFDISKIGTGEGAQAYGHGLYFADNEGVARSYRDALSGPDHLINGKPPADNIEATAARYLASPRVGTPEERYRDAIATLDMNDAQFKKVKRGIPPDVSGLVRESIERLKNADIRSAGGHMYEVDINADPTDFLDWDKRLIDQPQVYDKIRGHADQVRQMGLEDAYKHFLDAAQLRGMTGGDFHTIARKHGDDALRADLMDAGIPGIKYLDEGSRNGSHWMDVSNGKISVLGPGRQSLGEFPDRESALAFAKRKNEESATRNYVVFDDSLIDILRKYGWAGIAALPAPQSREDHT